MAIKTLNRIRQEFHDWPVLSWVLTTFSVLMLFLVAMAFIHPTPPNVPMSPASALYSGTATTSEPTPESPSQLAFYATLKCPDDYATFNEKMAAFKQFTNFYYSQHPAATVNDMLAARYQFYEIKHCTAALARYQAVVSGTVNATTSATLNSAYKRVYSNASTTQ